MSDTWASTYLTTHVGSRLDGDSAPVLSLGYGYDLPDSPLSLEAQIYWVDDVKTDSLLGLALDSHWHLSRFTAHDWYGILGLGYHYSNHDQATQEGLFARIGLGYAWHFSDNWSIRLEAVQLCAMDGVDDSPRQVSIGVMYHFPADKESDIDLNQSPGIPIDMTFRPGLAILSPEQYDALDAHYDALLHATDAGQEVTFVAHGLDETLAHARAMRLVEYFIDLGLPVAQLHAQGQVGPDAMVYVLNPSPTK